MNATQITGLGEPELVGKKFLFQPPVVERKQPETIQVEKNKNAEKKPPVLIKESLGSERVRMTLGITKKSLSIIQEQQSRHRLQTGYALPKWKIIDDALELYEQSKAGKGNKDAKPVTSQ